MMKLKQVHEYKSCVRVSPLKHKFIWRALPAIDELFQLCDPTKTLAHERDHNIAYMHLHELLARLL